MKTAVSAFLKQNPGLVMVIVAIGFVATIVAMNIPNPEVADWEPNVPWQIAAGLLGSFVIAIGLLAEDNLGDERP